MKKGDKIVCINTSRDIYDGSVGHLCVPLKDHKTYTIAQILSWKHDAIEIFLEEVDANSYDPKRFVTLGEYRKMKLKNIVNKIHERG